MLLTLRFLRKEPKKKGSPCVWNLWICMLSMKWPQNTCFFSCSYKMWMWAANLLQDYSSLKKSFSSRSTHLCWAGIISFLLQSSPPKMIFKGAWNHWKLLVPDSWVIISLWSMPLCCNHGCNTVQHVVESLRLPATVGVFYLVLGDPFRQGNCKCMGEKSIPRVFCLKGDCCVSNSNGSPGFRSWGGWVFLQICPSTCTLKNSLSCFIIN